MSNTVAINAALELMLALLSRAGEISQLVQRANAESRDLTQEEWDAIVGADDAARQRLVDAIAAAKAKEVPPAP
jgi:hypothetical protein